MALEVASMALHTVGQCSSDELHPQPFILYVLKEKDLSYELAMFGSVDVAPAPWREKGYPEGNNHRKDFAVRHTKNIMICKQHVRPYKGIFQSLNLVSSPFSTKNL